MHKGLTLFLGCLLTFSSAWLGLVFAPYVQMDHQQPQPIEGTGASYPVAPQGAVLLGRDLYRANGCVYCHSQQVRPEGFGADIARGWGTRRTVPRDYLFDRPHLLGTMRTGPDLTNIGIRQPSASWHHLHLYNPKLTSPGSIMPPFAFLYARQRIVGEKAIDALELPPDSAWPADVPLSYRLRSGEQLVPTAEAKALVSYLQSLNRSEPLEETNR